MLKSLFKKFLKNRLLIKIIYVNKSKRKQISCKKYSELRVKTPRKISISGLKTFGATNLPAGTRTPLSGLKLRARPHDRTKTTLWTNSHVRIESNSLEFYNFCELLSLFLAILFCLIFPPFLTYTNSIPNAG